MLLDELIAEAAALFASDIHILPDRIYFHVAGKPQPSTRRRNVSDPVSAIIEEARSLIESSHWERLMQRFDSTGTTEFSLTRQLQAEDASFEVFRLRFQLSRFIEGISIVIRLNPITPPSTAELGIPPEFVELIKSERSGLILVSGATGSGKTTTVFSCLNELEYHSIITLEDPVEYILRPTDRLSVVQREYMRDFFDFAEAVKDMLRHSPTVIYVSETRDERTATNVLYAAETGHLVITTLHAYGAINAIDRFVNIFSIQNREQARYQLGLTLKAVFSQTLLPSLDPTKAYKNRVLLYELLTVKDDQTRALLLKPDTKSLRSLRTGLISFAQTAARLVKENLIDYEDALAAIPSDELHEFRRLLPPG